MVYLDMTDPNTNCPSCWNITGLSKRTCGKASSGYCTCDSVIFPVSGGAYTSVCGKIKGYQYGGTDTIMYMDLHIVQPGKHHHLDKSKMAKLVGMCI